MRLDGLAESLGKSTELQSVAQPDVAAAQIEMRLHFGADLSVASSFPGIANPPVRMARDNMALKKVSPFMVTGAWRIPDAS